MDEQIILIKDYEFFFLVAKEDGENNSHKFTQFLNERPLNELRPIDVVNRVFVIMEIYKFFQKEEAIVKFEEFLGVVLKDVVAFNVDFEDIVIEILPNTWDMWEC